MHIPLETGTHPAERVFTSLGKAVYIPLKKGTHIPLNSGTPPPGKRCTSPLETGTHPVERVFTALGKAVYIPLERDTHVCQKGSHPSKKRRTHPPEKGYASRGPDSTKGTKLGGGSGLADSGAKVGPPRQAPKKTRKILWCLWCLWCRRKFLHVGVAEIDFQLKI